MTIRILINGAEGKMGALTTKTLNAHSDFTVVGTCSRQHDLASEIKKLEPQVVIDFTNAGSVFKNTDIIINAGVHPVIGSSGLLKTQIDELTERCTKLKLGGIIAPNFSLGAVLMMKYAGEIAKYFNQAEIIEMHHAGKQDSPSGTALRTAELIAAGRSSKPQLLEQTKETIPGARGAMFDHVPIHSVRLSGFVASQEVIFGGTGEKLTLRHDSIDREAFMPGVVLACKKVMQLTGLIYGLEQLL